MSAIAVDFKPNARKVAIPNGRVMIERGFVVFHPGFVKITGGHPSHGILLAGMVAMQCWYEEQGVYEWPCSMREWHSRLGISEHQIRDAIGFLTKEKIISTSRVGCPPIRYYCLEWDLFEQRWQEAVGFAFTDWYASE